MSYKERQVITSMTAGFIILASYIGYAYSQYQANTNILSDLKYWAGLMLSFIVIGIVVNIVIQIIFHILYAVGIAVVEREKGDKEIEKRVNSEFVEDERDRIIELKALRIGFFTAGIGFALGLLALCLNFQPGTMLNIFFISMMSGSILEGFAQLYYYKKG